MGPTLKGRLASPFPLVKNSRWLLPTLFASRSPIATRARSRGSGLGLSLADVDVRSDSRIDRATTTNDAWHRDSTELRVIARLAGGDRCAGSGGEVLERDTLTRDYQSTDPACLGRQVTARPRVRP